MAKTKAEGKPVAYSNGMQRVLVHLKHQGTHYVLLFDYFTKGIYLNRLKSVLPIEIYASENFEKIEDDEEYSSIYNIIKSYGIEI